MREPNRNGDEPPSGRDNVPYLKIGHVAGLLGISTARIRLWEHEKLLVPARTDGGQRRYSPQDVEKLKKIRTLLDTKAMRFRGVREALKGEDLFSAIETATASTDPVGARIKRRRTELGMSLRDLARITGISPSALSAFERGVSNPNTGRLSKIAHAVDLTVPDLLGVAHHENQMIVRHGQRESLPLSDEGVTIDLLYQSSTALQSQSITIQPGCGIFEAISHVGEDFVTVVTGSIDLELDGIEVHRLDEGDSATFPSHRAHSFRNPGDMLARLIWVNTPPTF